MFKVTNIEDTPNPDALKFVLDAPVVESGSRQFENASTAAEDPLAQALFKIPGVTTVFYLGQFVTVSKDAGTNWNSIGPKIIQVLQNASGKTNGHAVGKANGAATTSTGNSGELWQKINDIIDESVRPALAGDGGGLEVKALDGYTLTIRYQGACGSCPSSTAGTMMAIQNLLQRMVDPRIKVVSDTAGMMGGH